MLSIWNDWRDLLLLSNPACQFFRPVVVSGFIVTRRLKDISMNDINLILLCFTTFKGPGWRKW